MAGDLNLDELLGEKYVKHYLKILRSANSLFWVVPDPEEPDAWTTTTVRQVIVDREDADPAIDKRGTGPADCSACTVLALLPEVCWDVRGYYRRLGVHWKATRKELKAAYEAMGGPDSPSITYAFKQLLNDEIRRAYDRVPLGGAWLDHEAQDEIRQEAAREAARRSSRADSPLDYSQILKDWGYMHVRKEEDPGIGKRSRRPEPEHVPDDLEEALSTRLGGTISDWELNWAWYRMGNARTPARAGELLEEWQKLLVSAFSAADLRVRFAVGFFSGIGFRLWRNSRGLCIVFLATNEPPTPVLASEAVKGYLAHEQKR